MKKKNRKGRKPRFIPRNGIDHQFYNLFLKPFMRNYVFTDGQNHFSEGIKAFFGAHYRSVYWCRATQPFELPGWIWRTPDDPSIRYPAGGNRRVTKGNQLVIREDLRTPNRIDIEFKNQVFMLKKSQWDVIQEKIQRIA